MQDKFERLIKVFYSRHKPGQIKPEGSHPEEEILVCFIEGRLSEEENNKLKAHLLSCDECQEAFALNLQLDAEQAEGMPKELFSLAKELLDNKGKPQALEIILRMKEKLLEIISTSGDVLVGQELVPAPILRSRQIKDFKDEVTILKDFKDIRVEAKIENKAGKLFNFAIAIKQKETQKTLKDLRVTLFKDNLELESYVTDSHTVIFENVHLGKYIIEISAIDQKLASILLDIKA